MPPGHILIISRGNVFDETLFAEPKELLKRPLAEGALYLENQRIQYIHVLCLARQGGEHDQIKNFKDSYDEEEFTSPIIWPYGFLELCKRERIGEIPSELQTMKSEAGEDPNHIFPLRDVEVQFRVKYQHRGEIQYRGSLSYAQLMREAYPGAVYYYTAQPYRVVRVNIRSREVDVRHEKRYTTSPTQLPTMIFPNLAPENIFKARIYGKISCTECSLQVHEKLIGYKEKRGPTEVVFQYPIDSSNPKTSGIYFNQQKFSRNYFTTGIILTHPILNNNKDETELIGSMLFEAFLIILPFERRDVSFGIDKHRMAREQFGIEKESKFIAIYDQTYGSLRLTSRLLVEDTLRLIIEKAIEICKVGNIASANREIIKDLEVLLDEAEQKPIDHDVQIKNECRVDDNLIKVILPDSKGLALCSGNDGKGQFGDNKGYLVKGIFFDPKTQKLSYRGKFTDEKYKSETAVHILTVDKVVEISGESSMGYYSMDTGEIKTV